MPEDMVDREPVLENLDSDARDRILQILLNIPNDLILLFNPDGSLVLANDTFLSRSGFSLREISGKNIADLLPAPLGKARQEVLRQVAETGKPMRFEDHGVIGWYDNIIYPIFDSSGRVEKIVVQARDISARKQIEAELQDSLGTIKTLLAGPADYSVLVDTHGRIIMANGTFCRLFNLSEEQARGQIIFSLIPARIHESLREKMRQAVATAERIRYQEKNDAGYFDNFINPIVDSDGRVRRVALMSRDITEVAENEKNQRRNEVLIQTVINNAPLVLFALDHTGKVELLTGKALDKTGLPDDAIGKNIWELVPQTLKTSPYIYRAFEGESFSHTFDLSYKQNGGAIFETHFFPQLDADRNVEGVVGLGLDITDLTRALEEIQRSRNEFEVILGSISDGVAVRDKNMRLIYANDAAARLIGQASAKDYMAMGQPGDNFWVIGADGRRIRLTDFYRDNLKLLQSAAPLEFPYRIDEHGQERWLHLKTAPIRDENGEVAMIVFITRDITEQKRTMDELHRSRDELHKRVAERTTDLAEANQGLRNEIDLRRQAENELRSAVARAEALASIAARLNALHDLREIVQTICGEALNLSRYDTASVALYDETQDRLYIAAAQGAGALQHLQSKPITRAQLETWLENYGQMRIIQDLQRQPSNSEVKHWLDPQTSTLLVIRMAHAGELIGALLICAHEKIKIPTEDDLVMLRGIANLGATSIAKGLQFQQLDDARQRLQEVSMKLLDVQDAERRKLAIELHDQIGQMLTSLGMKLDQVERDVRSLPPSRSAAAGDEIHIARQQVREVLEQVREMSLRLRPPMLDELGLVPALLADFERFSASTGIRVDFRHSGLYDRFPASTENAIFRMIQEGLTNVARYAGVNEVSVRLLAQDDLLVAQVRDQGAGFDPSLRLAERASSGLSGMSERIDVCGGVLTIESEPGHGTCLTAEFPLEPVQKAGG